MYGLIKQLLLPPGSLILGLMAAMVLAHLGRLRLAKGIGLPCLAFLYLMSTPIFAALLMMAAQWGTEPLDDIQDAEVIVVLSAGAQTPTPEYGQFASVGALTLERLRYGAYLHRETDLPVLVTGGNWSSMNIPLGKIMGEVLEEDFQVSEVWVENRSSTTRKNARYSARFLKEKDITRVLLVTHAWHMGRAKAVFEHEGLKVIAAPTGFEGRSGFHLNHLFPQTNALHESYYAVHELVGRVWYWLLRLP